TGTGAAHAGAGNERRRSRTAPAPPKTRINVSAAATAVRLADNRMRSDLKRRAVNWRSTSKPQASTDTRSLPEARVGPGGHEHAVRVGGGAGLRDDDPVRRHERLRNRDRFPFSRVHADEISDPNMLGQLRDAGDREVRSMAERSEEHTSELQSR